MLSMDLSVCHNVFIHLFGGHLGCFHVSTLVNDAAVNMGVHISLRESDFISFRHIPRKWNF